MIVGFDIGTTTCRSAVFANEKPVLLKQFPSVISVNKSIVLVGDAAIENSLNNPSCTIYETKRIFESLFGGETQREQQEFELYKILWSFPIEATSDKTYAFPIKDGETLSAYEIMRLLIQELKIVTEDALGTKITDIVLTIPNFFANTHRVSMQKAVESCGLTIKRMLTDSSAAAFYYTSLRDPNKGKQKVLIYSMGSGSVNVALFIMDSGKVETKAAAYNKYIGGCDFQNEVHRLCCAKAKQLFGQPITGDRLAMLKLHFVSKKIVETLSTETSYSIDIPNLFQGMHFKWVFTRETFEKASKKRLDEVLDPIFDILQHSNVMKEEIDCVLLVGGSVRIPRVVFMIEKMFLGKEIIKDMDVENTALFGAAIQGEMLARQEKSLKSLDLPYVQSPMESNKLLQKDTPNNYDSPVVIRTPIESPKDDSTFKEETKRVLSPKFFPSDIRSPPACPPQPLLKNATPKTSNPVTSLFSFESPSSGSFGEVTAPHLLRKK
jgi:molecular chaperone DnaK (HSP70)